VHTVNAAHSVDIIAAPCTQTLSPDFGQVFLKRAMQQNLRDAIISDFHALQASIHVNLIASSGSMALLSCEGFQTMTQPTCSKPPFAISAAVFFVIP